MRFGILGTAAIARRAFVPAVETTDHEITAVASRDENRARAFADEFGIKTAHGSYEAMLSDSDIDAVYLPPEHVARGVDDPGCSRRQKRAL